jgi:hypothetical protein
VLAQVLPGVRDLRAPLTAGYLWLLLIWLVGHDELEGLLDRPPLDQLAALAPATQGIGIAVVLSVVAYLIGSLVDAFVAMLATTPQRLRQHSRSQADERTSFEDHLFRRSIAGIAARRTRLSAEGRRLLDEWASEQVRARRLARTLDDLQLWDRGELRHRMLAYLVAAQFDLVKIQLLAVSPDLHGQVDRKDSEAEFRAMIALPLALLMVWLGLDGAGWLFAPLGLLVATALTWHSVALRREAGTDLVLAMRARRIDPPVLTELVEQARPDA